MTQPHLLAGRKLGGDWMGDVTWVSGIHTGDHEDVMDIVGYIRLWRRVLEIQSEKTSKGGERSSTEKG
jgi:hypothetical protein